MKPTNFKENQWHSPDDLEEVLTFIKNRSDWSWAKNMKCKYVDIRFDMRDGAFLIRDRDGLRISLSELKHQIGTSNEELGDE